MAKRTPWFDPKTNDPLIDDYAKKLESFVSAIADGEISNKEITDQETRVVDLMKKVEPQLNDEQHEAVTKLLCEVTAYDIMMMLRSLQDTRPKTKFVG